jgi:DNA invertase Pin-like site-specific DNA recombinase
MKAVIYGAKSTADKHLSIPGQIEDGQEKAEAEGWEIVGECSDEGFSAFSGNRGPGLEQAKRIAAQTAAKSGEVCMVDRPAQRSLRSRCWR